MNELYRAREIDSIQKRLFKAYDDFKSIYENSELYWQYTKEDIKGVIALVSKFRNSPYLSNKYLWGV